jgi:hypothetical protein
MDDVMGMKPEGSEERTTMDRKRLRDMLESCRPDFDDLSEPEMADAARALQDDPGLRAAFERQKRQDRRLLETFSQVDVPADLQQRILSRLAEAASRQTTLHVPESRFADASSKSASEASAEVDASFLMSDSAPAEGQATLAAQKSSDPENAAGESAANGGRSPNGVSGSRRLWLWSSLATAATILIVLGWLSQRPTAPSIELLAQATLEWTEAIERGEVEVGDWQEFRESDFPDLRWRAGQWQRLPTKLDAEVVVFDFGSIRGSRLLLYQVTTRHRLPLPKIPYEALSVTGGWQSGAWQEGEHIFIAVTTDPQILDSFRGAYSPT